VDASLGEEDLDDRENARMRKYNPNTVTRKTEVARGAVIKRRPKISARPPSTKTPHQGYRISLKAVAILLSM
jgi:hypothetical protein